MFRIRPIRHEDFEELRQLSNQAQAGITNLPKYPPRLKKIHENALLTFSGKSTSPYYLFALEDAKSSKLVGISGIYPQTGVNTPLEYFKLNSLPISSTWPEAKKQVEFLEIVRYQQGPTEICSLFMSPVARKEGLGRLLSFSRFLFMKAFPHLFHQQVFAEMRGYIDPSGRSPFWDAVGSHFLPLTYLELLKRRDHGIAGASSLFPACSILIDLLPDSAQKVIGLTHPNTVPAKKILEEQGFRYTREVDLYDAGPRLIVEREQIVTYRNAQRLRVVSIEKCNEAPLLLAKPSMDFRACLASAHANEKGITLSNEGANLLEVGEGDEILAVL